MQHVLLSVLHILDKLLNNRYHLSIAVLLPLVALLLPSVQTINRSRFTCLHWKIMLLNASAVACIPGNAGTACSWSPPPSEPVGSSEYFCSDFTRLQQTHAPVCDA